SAGRPRHPRRQLRPGRAGAGAPEKRELRRGGAPPRLPHARPVPHRSGDVIEAFVALGSSLGDRLANLGAAVELIAREPGFSLRRVSLAYETEPVGPPQPRFLNAVLQAGTLLSPRATLQKLHEVEEQLGRVRREHHGAREIDLDLLLSGDRISDAPRIPHPRVPERAL